MRVRKLTGKPAFLTIADSESETPRIHYLTDYEDVLSPSIAESNAFRIHLDRACPLSFAAASICLASDWLNRAEMNTALATSMPIFGLPTLFFIINVSQIC
jgi:hypothetical protein